MTFRETLTEFNNRRAKMLTIRTANTPAAILDDEWAIATILEKLAEQEELTHD